MLGGGREYTLFFAWVEEDTPWSVELARFDEAIFDMVIDHAETEIPSAVIEIMNPRIGLLNPTRLYWAWLSFSVDACPVQPLMFGRVIGIPDDGQENTIRIKLITRDTDYQYQKQQVANLLKISPNYDPIFFEVAKRDDPDAILEGWPALYHVDRVDGRVSASNYNVGEDGTVDFSSEHVFYDSLKWKIVQVPLRAINIKMEVQWKQQYRGHIDMGSWAFPTLGGDAFIGDWPKSGTAIGPGWTSGVSWAGQRDPSIEQAMLATQKPQQTSISYSWVNQAKTHRTGDTMSVSFNYTKPFGNTIQLKFKGQNGLIDPFHVDSYGDPDPINRPAKQNIDWFCYRTFDLNFLGRQSVATLGVCYAADRQRNERLEATLLADVQAVLTDPDVTEDTEEIVLKSGDLSLPLIELENWDSVGRGGAVELGQFIYPSSPLVPGQKSTQIAVQAGNTGDEIPTFSNIAGQTTLDGTVIWASLGSTPPVEGSQDWVRSARVPLGTLLNPRPVAGVPDMASALAAGNLNYPPTGFPVSKYQIFSAGWDGPGAAMYECYQGGMVGGLSAGEHADFLNFINPSGKYLYLCIQAGTSGGFHTTFDETVGSQTTDGDVIWQNIGLINLPIGGSPGMTPAAAYFPTDRGRQSVLHGFCRGRAKLRKRARAVEVRFDTRFEVAAMLSCRMNGRVNDIRLPGGTAWGKIVSYRIEAHGGTGQLKGSVVLGCTVGTNTGTHSDLSDAGDPCYVREGYVRRGYQRYYSTGAELTPGDPNYRAPGTAAQLGVSFATAETPHDWPATPSTLPPEDCLPLPTTWSNTAPTVVSGDEFGYTPPVYEAVDDGLIFPAGRGSLVLSSEWHGLASTINPINLAIYNLQLEQIIHSAVAQANATQEFGGYGGPISGSITVPITPFYDIQVAVQMAVWQAMLQGMGLWYELALKPVVNGPFMGAYIIQTTPMQIEQMIDLAAASAGGP